jgi:hypothetical protein
LSQSEIDKTPKNSSKKAKIPMDIKKHKKWVMVEK